MRVLVLFLVLLLAVVPVSEASAYSGSGSGTSTNPYRIYDCSQFFEINDDLDGYYVLENDVDCTGVAWEHIGVLTSSYFSGTLDGQGYTMRNLTVSDTNGVGLFTYINGATITNIELSNFDITGTGTVGALSARADNATISFVRVKDSTVRSEYATGGMVGILNTSAVSDSAVIDTTVTGRSGASFAEQIGGFVGLSDGNTYMRSFTSGSVNAVSGLPMSIEDTGGFVGYANGDIVDDSYSTSEVSGDINVGGFSGNQVSSVYHRSYASGAVNGNSRVGGFSGMSALSYVENSFATGLVSGNTMTGGLIGRVYAIGGDVYNSTWDVTRTDQTNCIGADQGMSYTGVCLAGVNVADAEPNYFFNSSTNAPLDNWNFSTVWQTEVTGLPLLRTTPQRVDTVRVLRGDTSLRVSWEIPADTGGSAITGYDLKYRASSSTTYTQVPLIVASGSAEYTITGLSPQSEYVVEIRARNGVGLGVWSGFVTTTLSATAKSLSTSSSSTGAITEEVSVVPPTSSSEPSMQDGSSEVEGTPATTPSSSSLPVVIVLSVVIILGFVTTIAVYRSRRSTH